MQLAALADQMRPLRRLEYDRLVDLGLFEGEKVELLRGVIVRMSPQGVAHASTIQSLTQLLVLALAATKRAAVRVQLPLALADDSEPEPDIAVVEPGDYREQHPSRALIVIEVADSSLTLDRGEKAELYARAGIPEYWIVDVGRRLLEVHTDAVAGVYTRVVPYSRKDVVSPRAFPEVSIRVDAILG